MQRIVEIHKVRKLYICLWSFIRSSIQGFASIVCPPKR
ncbi:unnamed protein product [Arabidopsis halleri]